MRALSAAALLFALAVAGCAHGPAAESHTPMRKELARQLIARGDWSGAFEVLNKLYRESPDDPEVMALRGVVYRENGLLEDARVELERAVIRAPESAFARSALAITLDDAGELQRAAENHRRAVELQPDSPAYLNNLAFSDFARGRLEEAIAGFEQALRLDPTNAQIRNNLGFALARAGKLGRASDQFARAGSPAEAKTNLGYAHELAGDFAKAFELYTEAARLEPGAARARENLAGLARRTGRPLPQEAASLVGKER